MMRILITGTNGYIGNYLSKSLNYDITCLHRDVCDLTNSIDLANFFYKNGMFDVVIHCAAVGGSRLKKDDSSIFDNNVQMFLNLVKNKNHFGRLIHFGSGAQKVDKGPYGFSKRVIANMIEELDNFYNIIIYGLFDENELNTRFIKSCVNHCFNKTSIQINENKLMDFFHMKDLESVVDHYINKSNPPKTIECSYSEKFTLIQLAYMIKTICKSNSSVNYGGGDVELNYSGKNTEYLNNIIYDNFTSRLEETIIKLQENR
jgi:GDP-L-fucose synthase|tara:strand:+ start:5072 stop:5851 length:780 start_codon:yes stop_codon:yes gene_type:complete